MKFEEIYERTTALENSVNLKRHRYLVFLSGRSGAGGTGLRRREPKGCMIAALGVYLDGVFRSTR